MSEPDDVSARLDRMRADHRLTHPEAYSPEDYEEPVPWDASEDTEPAAVPAAPVTLDGGKEAGTGNDPHIFVKGKCVTCGQPPKPDVPRPIPLRPFVDPATGRVPEKSEDQPQEYRDLLGDLEDWLRYFLVAHNIRRTSFPYECWRSHPAVVEDLVALYAAYQVMVEYPQAHAADDLAFMDKARGALMRIAVYGRRCSTVKGHRYDRPVPIELLRVNQDARQQLENLGRP